MTWQQDIDAYRLLSITTGDGVEYDFKTKFKGGSVNPLTASYNYAGKVGTKPTRNSSASPVYDLLFYVHSDKLKAFLISVSDPSEEWIVKHPLYGDLKGQPTSINWDGSKQGDVEFNVQFQDSIKDDTPLVLVDYRQRILAQNLEIKTITEIRFAETLPSVEEINILGDFVDNLEDVYDAVLDSDIANLFYDIRQVIQDTVFDSLRFMVLMNQILNTGSQLSLNGILYPLSTRFELMKGQNALIVDLDADTDSLSPDGNQSDVIAVFKELSGASNSGAISITVATPAESQNDVSGFDIIDTSNVGAEDDYRYKSQVDSTILETNQLYNDYVDSLDEIDIETQGFVQYSPDDNLSSAAKNTILLGIQEIKEISVKAKEESIHITLKDTVPEILAFELYGIASEENTNEIINNNDLFGKNSIKHSWRDLVIRKNTKIKYYV